MVPDSFIMRWWFKIRHIMPTLIYIQFGTIAVLMLIRLLVMYFDLFELKDETWEMWIPVVGSWIPLLIWLQLKIKIFSTGRMSSQTIFLGLGWVAMIVPLVLSQYYLEERVGVSVVVNSVEELNNQPPARFYQVKDLEIDTFNIAVGEVISEKGHERHEKVLTLYFIAPASADTSQKQIYWFGNVYKHGNGVKEYLPQHHDSCYARDRGRFINRDFRSVDYLVNLNTSDDKDGFMKTVASVSPTLVEKSIMLVPGQGSFEERGDESLGMVFYSALIADLIYAFLLLLPKYDL